MRLSFKRQAKGVSAIEVAVAAFVVIVMAAIGVDMCILTMAFQILDAATRDAARAAGAQNTPYLAYQAAIAQLSMHATDGKFILQPTLYGSESKGTPYDPKGYFIYQDWNQCPPPNGVTNPPPILSNASAPDKPPVFTEYQCPYVTVTCQIQVHLPVGIPFFGNNISNNAAFDSNGYMTFLRKYTYPIVKTQLF